MQTDIRRTHRPIGCRLGLHSESRAGQWSEHPGARYGNQAVTGLKIWGTPWSNVFMGWSFMKPPAELARIYASIPDSVNILLSHQPPYGYGDQMYDSGRERFDHLGTREFLSIINRIRPRLVVGGHIYSGHGRYMRNGLEICNVSVVDNHYCHVHAPTVIELFPPPAA